ncbi:hypothetical protein ACKKBF_B37060 [Auxenochlorella protothecoides x Auxenochlorella symbiontica]
MRRECRLGMFQSETLVKVQDVKLCVIQGNPNPRLPFGGQGIALSLWHRPLAPASVRGSPQAPAGGSPRL